MALYASTHPYMDRNAQADAQRNVIGRPEHILPAWQPEAANGQQEKATHQIGMPEIQHRPGPPYLAGVAQSVDGS